MKGILADLLIKLGLDSKEFNAGVDKAKNKTDIFSQGIKKLRNLFAGVFAVNKVISFGKELVKLSGDIEGVRSAFMKMSDVSTLEKLKDATKGTVSELDLMKRAVQAQNLGLPIKDLASLFEFATKRAQDTGQSVDYLVDSIVLGIGRKSPLILDNLGISAIALKEKLKGVGMETASVADIARAVGEIAADSMKRSGEIIDTNAIKIQNLSAEWTNFKTNLSENEGIKKSIGGITDALRAYLNVLTSSDVTIWGKLFASFDVTGNMFRKLDAEVKKREELKKTNDENRDSYIAYMQSLSKANTEEEKHTKTLSELVDETKALEDSLGSYGINQTAEIQKTLQQIEANKKLIESLTTLKTKRDNLMPGGDFMIKPITELPIIGQSSSALGSQTTLAPELNGINEFLEKNKKRYEELLKEYQEPFNRFKEDMAMAVADFGVNVVEEFGQSIGEMIASGNFDFSNFGKTILAGIGGFISQLGKMLIGLGIASEAFQALLKSAFTNPASAGLAIAAGAALVLLGGAIQGFAKAGPNGASSSGSVSAPSYSRAGSPSSGYRAEDNKVVFEIKGDKLVGVLSNVQRKNLNMA